MEHCSGVTFANHMQVLATDYDAPGPNSMIQYDTFGNEVFSIDNVTGNRVRLVMCGADLAGLM